MENRISTLGKRVMPLPINVFQFQIFNFESLSIQGAILFCWLVVKARSFRYNQFFYHFHRIENETGLDKETVLSLCEIFGEWGFITFSKLDTRRMFVFNINFEALRDKEVLVKIYKESYIIKLLAWYNKQAIRYKKSNGEIEPGEPVPMPQSFAEFSKSFQSRFDKKTFLSSQSWDS